MKKRWLGIMTALAGVLLAGTTQAALVETSINLASAGTYSNASAHVITTAMEYNGATFDINYTLGSTSVSNNPFVQSNGSQMGVGSDGDISNHYLTLEGNDGEGMSFTGLSISNFVANSSGLVLDDLSDLGFISFITFASGNANDGAFVSFTGFTNDTVEVNLSGSNPTNDLTGLANYPVLPDVASNLYIKVDNGASNNRWAISGIGVSFAVNTGENEAPIADAQELQTLPYSSISNIVLTAFDFEGSNLTYTIETFPLQGSLVGASNVWTYTTTNGFEGVDSFTFTANDGELDSDPATVTINVTNELPVATAQSVEALRNTPLDITLTGTDTDGPSNLTFTVVGLPTHGTLNTNASPNISYTPDNGYVGGDFFTFTAFDGFGSSSAATVTVTVVNNPPVADSKITLTAPDTPVAITLTGSDPEGSSLIFNVETLPANGDLTGTEPNMTYTPTNGFTGVDSFTYTAYDGESTSSVATVSISVSTGEFNLPFIDFNPSTNANTLSVGGIPATVVGVTNGLDYVYSVSFTGADIDGDATNDEVTFDIRVQAWTNGVTDLGFDSVQGSSNISSVVIGTSNIVPQISTLDSFTTAGNSMFDGSTLGFFIENVGVTLTDPNQDGTAVSTGFSEAHLQEINRGHSHHVIFGEGTGLLGWFWSTPDDLYVSDLDQGPNTLYVSASMTSNTAATRPMNWGVKNLDFGITVELVSAAIPPVSIDLSGNDLTFMWEGGGTYDLLTNANLVLPNWGVVISGATSPVTVTNATTSEPVLFFKLSE
ncbi:Ig-like domain-containing protein [Pontiella sp.]|uniref:beta strand repeat-containing protein n=1 Tax=Pontiella sp. TaxID=2837462 RepID=UPI003563CF0E